MPSAARAAKNESLFREVNEQILHLEERFGGDSPSSQFVCECSRRDCSEKLDASLDEYRAVREVDTYFIVLRAHVDVEHERVVRSTDRHTVVEKLGLAGEIAEAEA
jgi:hypothetical protein